MSTAATTTTTGSFGDTLRSWRERRRWSQLDLATEAGVSQRHVSFLETGRSRPSREMVIHLAGVLDVALRARNEGLLAAGYAPVYPERSLRSPAMDHVRQVLTQLIEAHDPFPAYVVDRARWDLVLVNEAALAVTGSLVAPETIADLGGNILRLTLHPDGIRPHLANWPDVAVVLVRRLAHEVADRPGDAVLSDLLDEVRGYPGVADLPADIAPPTGADLLVPLHLRTGSFDLRLFTAISTIGSPHDVTLEELRLETLLPADAETSEALHHLRR